MVENVFAPINLQCEYATQPIGLDRPHPRFSWHVPANVRGQRQTAYEILVSSIESDADTFCADMWDSGRVDSDCSIHVRYNGKPLASRGRYYWMVRIWDKDNNVSPYSQVSSFEMGLLDSQDWVAKWIELDYEVTEGNEQPCPLFRKEFDVVGPVRRARVYVSALGLYELYINGHRVGDHILAPEWTDYHQRVQYQTYDVTDIIQENKNAIGAMLGYGWYAGRVGIPPKEMGLRGFYGDRPRLLVQLEIETKDGQVYTICSDESWKGTIGGPVVNSCILDGERQDARREMRGWNQPGFDDADWVGARIYPVGNCKLVSQYNEPIRIMHDLVPIAITEPAPGTYVFDMGQNMVGWCRLKATGPRGTVVTLRHAEALQDDGNIYTENLRNAMQTDTFILSGEGIEVLEPHFTYHGFRYVEVTGLPNKPLLEDLTGRVFYSSAPATGAFECSDSMLNKLMENIVWTQRGNMHSTPTDCPQRDERLGWMGDAQLFSQTACYNMQMARFFTKWAADIRDAQTDEGVFSVFSPNPYKHLNQGLGAPGWSDAGVIIPWRVYLNYGDKELLHEHYQAAAAWVDYVWKHNQDLIWRHQRGSDFGDWLNADTLDLADWPDSGGQVPNEVYATCFFAHSADLVARMAAIVGDEVGAKRYSQLFNDVKAAFCREFVSADGRITGDTQAGYALALHFDLLPQDLRDTALKYLLEGIERYNGHPSTGIQATNRMMLELVRGGRADVAYDLLTKRTVPSWFYMIECGATTIWERWDGYVKGRGFQTPRMNSFNHYAFGAIGEWIFRNIAGINLDVDEPAFKHIIIKPVIGGGITYAKGKYDSMYGEIQSSWSKSEHEFRLEIAIPGNTTATVYLPFGDPNLVTESGARLENSEQIELLQVDGEQMVLRVGAGRYSFVVTQ